MFLDLEQSIKEAELTSFFTATYCRETNPAIEEEIVTEDGIGRKTSAPSADVGRKPR
ncbi:TPA: hypothetical protein ACHU7H_001442 [Streptococcus suis]|nr:hypothetical protein [Streptococcus suis]